MARELTPRAYKRLLKAFTPEQAKISVEKWIDDNRKKYSSTNEKVYIDGDVFKHKRGGEVSKRLRLAIFRKINTIIGKQMSKAAQKRWKNREASMNDKVIDEYRRIASSKRLQTFYKNAIKADVADGESALKQHANTAEVTNIKTPGLKGLLKIHLLEPKMRESASRFGSQKMQLDVTMLGEDDKGESFDFKTRTRIYIVGNADEVPEIMSKMVTELQLLIEEKMLHKSNLKIKSVEKLTLHFSDYKPLAGAEYIPLPECIARTISCSNTQNEDKHCFRYAALCAVKRVFDKPHAEQPVKYAKYADQKDVKFGSLPSPMPLDAISQFEDMNDHRFAINVYGLRDAEGKEKELRSKMVDVLRISPVTNPQLHINLLYLEADGKAHYLLIKDFDKLMFGQHSKCKSKKHFCPSCLHCFRKGETLQEHKEKGCYAKEGQRYEMPDEGSTIKFNNIYNQECSPFVVYLDFEAAPVPVEEGILGNKTTVKADHQVVSYCMHVVSRISGINIEPVLYRGPNAVENLLDNLKMLEIELNKYFHMKKPMWMTDENKESFRCATQCRFCKGELNGDKVRDHCHMTGKYRGPAHNVCNVNYHNRYTKVPVFCHNLKGYDSHFIIAEAYKYECNKKKKIDVIAQNSEKFLTFGFNRFQFKDSLSFLNASLDKLVKMNKYTKGKKQENWQANFHHTRCMLNERINCDEDVDALTEKGVYPYAYMSSFEKFEETQLPPKEAFYNDLSEEHCPDEMYERAHAVWDRFALSNLGDYHDIYLLTDVGLLADVYENFRDMCMEYYGLDPAHYLTLPHFGWDAMLKYTGVELELLHDIEMYNMVESAKRGGMVQVSKRFAEAHNKHIDEKYEGESNYIMYLDANNLYGWAMSQKLPETGFEWY